ncbi:hypothetical protein L5515_013644 [Caenorhabditis briggsae]|uniref:Protein smg-9 n=2 Tax=Caenorhabditis briggsae TaxID=6238 RepID=A0AAE9E9T4_CAEBR|nr:hypothetical protein L5515_013644 [Caenorhabditis briggsae]
MKKVEILKTPVIQQRPVAPSRTSSPPVTAPRIAIKPRPPPASGNSGIPENNGPISPPDSSVSKSSGMKESVRFLNDIGEITDSISDLLTNSPNFNVISAIGPQGAGKSTILSMLAGNNSRQMYREYVFRPVSREANEQSRHQTTQIDIYVTNHQIFLDCQPMHSFSIMEGLPKLRGGRLDEATAMSDTLRLTAFLLFISHTVLVISETHFDKTVIDTIRTSEQIRPWLHQFRPKLSIERMTNLVFIKTKASSIDTAPSVIRERAQLLRLAFRDSKWLKISKEPFKCLLVLEEIRVKREHLYEGEDEIDETMLNEFDEHIAQLRVMLQRNRDDFTVETAAMDEKKWLEMCQEVIRDKTFHRILKEFHRSDRDRSSIYAENGDR